MTDRRLRTLPQTTADHLLERYGADVGEILDIAAVMPGALRPIADGEPAVVAERREEARGLAVIFGAVAVAFAASASPASAAFTLNLSAPEPVVVGQPAVLQATGTLDADEFEYLFWFSLDAIPTSVTTRAARSASAGG